MSEKHHLLIIENDEDISYMLDIYFTGQGYDVTIDDVGDISIMMLLSNSLPDCILLDTDTFDGKTFRQAMRVLGLEIPIVYLCLRNEYSDRIC